MTTALPATPDVALAAHDLVKTYPTGRKTEPVRALDGLSLQVPVGTVFGLLGRNGAGKSTTVKILTTLSRPDAGTAQVAGLDVTRQPGRVRRVIGLVSQKASSDPIATGRENLVLAARIQGLSSRDATRRSAELLDRFDLADSADRQVRTYSGGMARKLDVAIGLVHRPRVLFLDEPTAGLDPEARSEMWHEIARLADQEQMTVLLTTHYLDEADRLADQLAIVDHGRVIATGSPDELKRRLRGDTVTVEFADVPIAEKARATLAEAGQVRDLTLTGAVLRGRADQGATAVPAVLLTLERAGITAASVSVARPTLDDVYLDQVGHSFQEDQR
ncbi:MAG: ATP-binding cassette domain-containing protein [Jatrophihabitans sp.]